MGNNKTFSYINFMVIILLILLVFLSPSQFYSKHNISYLVHRISTATTLTCGLSFLLMLGRLDFSIAGQLAFLSSLLNLADSSWKINPLFLLLLSLSVSVFFGLWHHYWTDIRHIPSSFITGISSVFFFISLQNFLPTDPAEPHSLFFYILALNPLSSVSIYSIIVTLLFAFFVPYYLHLSNRLQYNLRTDQWIPFMILVLTLTSLGLAGFMRLHEYIQFRLVFFVGLLVFITFFILERFSRLGRRIYTIGSESQVAFLAGIPVSQVRRSIWILFSLLAGLLALFFRGSEVVFTPIEFIRLQGIVLSSCLLGGLSGGFNRMHVVQSTIAVICLVCFENLLDLWSIPPIVMSLANAGFLFLALSVSQFKPGQVT